MRKFSKKREAEILAEIRKRVFQRETELSDLARQSLDEEINLQVLEEMTESLNSDDIVKINDDVRREFAEREQGKRRLLTMIPLLLLMGLAIWLWPIPAAEDITPTAPAADLPIRGVQPPADDSPRVLPPRNPVEKPPAETTVPRNEELVEAVSLGLMETVKFLLNKGADPGTVAEDGTPVLNLAIDKRHSDIGQFLLINGAPLNIADDRGNTALHRAAYWGATDLVAGILEKGAEVDARNKKNLTPLMVAAFHGKDDVMQLLVDNGARLDYKDPRITPELLTSSRKLYFRAEHVTQRQALLDPAIDLKTDRSDYGNRALMNAAYSGDLRTVEILLDLGIKVNVTDRFGSTALISAAYGGQLAVARLLVNKGAYVNVRGKYGFTPLIAAVEGGCHGEFIKFLVANKADVTIKSESGNDVFVYMRGRCSKEMKAFFNTLNK